VAGALVPSGRMKTLCDFFPVGFSVYLLLSVTAPEVAPESCIHIGIGGLSCSSTRHVSRDQYFREWGMLGLLLLFLIAAFPFILTLPFTICHVPGPCQVLLLTNFQPFHLLSLSFFPIWCSCQVCGKPSSCSGGTPSSVVCPVLCPGLHLILVPLCSLCLLEVRSPSC
jgi:hypothetical protein